MLLGHRLQGVLILFAEGNPSATSCRGGGTNETQMRLCEVHTYAQWRTCISKRCVDQACHYAQLLTHDRG